MANYVWRSSFGKPVARRHTRDQERGEKTTGTFNWQQLSDECDNAQKALWKKCPPMKKNFYEEDPEVRACDEDDVNLFYMTNNMMVSRVFSDKKVDKVIPNPVRTFDQCFRYYGDIMEKIHHNQFQLPTPIQCLAWPVLLSGDDLIGIAQTGTGKTLAFLLPALIHIDGQPIAIREQGPNVLIMAPTRELALQIEREVQKYQYKGIKAVCIYGGGNRKDKVRAISKDVDIIIATPGRLNDLLAAGNLNLKSITFVVIDETNRMLDMGLEPEIRKILLDVRPDRQTVMTSATWPACANRLAKSYMDNPVQVYVGSLALAAAHTVTQTIEILDNEDTKLKMLMDWVTKMPPSAKVIVFCNKKAGADHVATELLMLGVDCENMHNGRDQGEREQALDDIASGKFQILVATDVASRGIDIQDITHVINYDFPCNIEEYVHRVGRTGRAGKTGESITYFTTNDWSHAKDLVNILREANQSVPIALSAMATVKDRRGRKERGRGGDRSRHHY